MAVSCPQPIAPEREAQKRADAVSADAGGGLPFAWTSDRMTPPLAPGLDTRASDDLGSRGESMNALAALLLDWRVDCERHLRALTCIQRWLERVRCGLASDGERDLLIQEMVRLLRETPPQHEGWARQAESYLNNI